MSNLPIDVPKFQNENGSIVMGIVRSLEYDDLKPFLTTLHSTGYAGGVTFFVMTYLPIREIYFHQWGFT